MAQKQKTSQLVQNPFGAIWIVAKNSIRESIRDRLYFLLFFLFIFLVALSVLLGQLSFAENARIFANMSLTAIHLVVLGLSVFIGSFSISREIEKQTYMVMLARPLRRAQFLMGKYLGIAFSLFVTVFVLCVAIGTIFMDVSKLPNILLIGSALYFEGLILLSLSFLFSLLLRPVIGIVCTITVYLTGHWLEDLNFFAEKSESIYFKYISKILNYVTPNLNLMNYRSYVFIEQGVEIKNIAWVCFHSIGWIGFLLFLATFAFKKKDLV